MGIKNPIRIALALGLLSCLLVLLMMPGAITAVVVQSHGNGKQFVRIISLLSMMVLAVGACCGVLQSPFSPHLLFREVYVHGFGPDLLDKTCARLC